MLKLSGLGLALACTMFVSGCLATVEVEVPEVCTTQHRVEFDPANYNLDVVNPQFTFDLREAFLALSDFDVEVGFTKGAIRAVSGIDNLSFVEGVRLTIFSDDPDSALPELEVYNCTDDCVPRGGVLELPASAGGSVLDYAKETSLIVDVAVTGALPSQAWALAVDVCLTGSAHYDLNP